MCSKTQWKSLKSHHVIKLKIHKFKQMSQIYAMFFTVKVTGDVFYNKQYSQGVNHLKTIKFYINRVLTSLYC